MTIEEIKTMASVIDHLIISGWKVDSELTPEGYILAEKGSRKWCIKVLPYQGGMKMTQNKKMKKEKK